MRCIVLPLLMVIPAVTACTDREAQAAQDAAMLAQDPVVARALNDPLMSDPDLASRNEANALIGFADSSALPTFAATTGAARAAREAARLELLDGGAIPDLPLPGTEPRGKALGPMVGPADLIAALGAPASCARQLDQNFTYAADLPPVASIMPHGMVVQAGGADSQICGIRIVRYQTAAAIEDVLEYHNAQAVRAGLRALRYRVPEDIIAASGARDETLVVHVRKPAKGLTSVDLLYRAP
ncbi:MAG TPA: hypothetical protein VK913_12590 [Erythrobacter sp.]|nr:hypothetical protein [Erythrobacter sp.]